MAAACGPCCAFDSLPTMFLSVPRRSRRSFVAATLWLLTACGSDVRQDMSRGTDAGAGYGGPEAGFPDAGADTGDASGDAAGDSNSDVAAKITDNTADGNLDAESGKRPASL